MTSLYDKGNKYKTKVCIHKAVHDTLTMTLAMDVSQNQLYQKANNCQHSCTDKQVTVQHNFL